MIKNHLSRCNGCGFNLGIKHILHDTSVYEKAKKSLHQNCSRSIMNYTYRNGSIEVMGTTRKCFCDRARQNRWFPNLRICLELSRFLKNLFKVPWLMITIISMLFFFTKCMLLRKDKHFFVYFSHKILVFCFVKVNYHLWIEHVYIGVRSTLSSLKSLFYKDWTRKWPEKQLFSTLNWCAL